MAKIGRREFLKTSAIAGAGLGLQILAPRWARGAWGDLGPGDAPSGGPYKTLFICCYGGVNPWQTFWVTPESAQQYGWTPAGPDAALLQSATCPPDDGTVPFGNDALGNPVSLGPATAPLWKNELLSRMRLVTLRGFADPHSVALAYAIGARRFGTPRFAGLGAAVERRMQEAAQRALPYSYTLFSNQIGLWRFLERYASARGQHPRFVGPLPLAMGSETFSSKLPRAQITPQLDALLASYRSSFRQRMRWPGSVEPLRSTGYSTYEVSADALSLGPQLQPILTPQALETAPGPQCIAALGAPDRLNATATSLALAADLFANHGARHVTILDSGLYSGPNGNEAPYDVHADVPGVSHSAVTTANMFNLLRNLVDRLDWSGGSGTGPGGISGGLARIDLATTLVIIVSEFGRNPGSGLSHHLDGMAAVLLGGPIQNPGICGGLDDGDAPLEHAYSHADVHAAALLVSEINPLAEPNLMFPSEFSAPIADGDVIGNLREKILAV